eukprot:scaffold67667_cov66-Phaeocystis_antarctica.AAC.1
MGVAALLCSRLREGGGRVGRNADPLTGSPGLAEGPGPPAGHRPTPSSRTPARAPRARAGGRRPRRPRQGRGRAWGRAARRCSPRAWPRHRARRQRRRATRRSAGASTAALAASHAVLARAACLRWPPSRRATPRTGRPPSCACAAAATCATARARSAAPPPPPPRA